ncbi:N-acetylglucosaminyldiphosphoundecaprenol N-acetyl-beta-D-mannosaminyltransferase [Roseateles sp. YR242]|uniref:WecB/TagA/CpsF family glycosyltransferase n=1 Tax=Roseateles sp. YR242 TaxID=1855305 RepID=UPI0008AB7C72|nr:WecB/TagA/CpsF family glycosyltransferase [Roseateles sp. YR242]SEK52538.1 N-acetylglucosaminyldiphosphoundecaprenol N-acetyl-beta-D-mannosaminyltransferase [Roseateles sp. YR242]
MSATLPMNAPAPVLPTIAVDGLPFVNSTVSQLADHIVTEAQAGRGGWVVTPNVDILRRWRLEPEFRALVADANVFTADGRPIVWASQLQGTPLPARLTGSDLFVQLVERGHAAGLRLALIGGNEGSAEAAAARLVPQGREATVRCLCPPFGFEQQPAEMARLEQLLTDWQPQIVFIGLGSPKQEKTIARLRPLAPQAWFLGVGVSFSFVAGDVQRAPGWMQRSGLEWVHRLVQEPGRLARRYLVDGIPFALGLLWRAARAKKHMAR